MVVTDEATAAEAERYEQCIACFAAAKRWLKHGVSVAPIVDDAKKPPQRFSLKRCYEKLPDENSIKEWFHPPAVKWNASQCCNLAIITGAVSGGIEVIDFDDPTIIDAYLANVPPRLNSKLSYVRTASGKLHLLYRRPASITHSGRIIPAKNPDRGIRIEVRGDGCYAVAVGSQRLRYVHEAGPLPWDPETITEEERDYLINMVAASFDQSPAPAPTPKPSVATSSKGVSLVGYRAAWQERAAQRSLSDVLPSDWYEEHGPSYETLLDAVPLARKKVGGRIYWYRDGHSTSQTQVSLTDYNGRTVCVLFSTGCGLTSKATASHAIATKFSIFADIYHKSGTKVDASTAAREIRQMMQGKVPMRPK